MESGDFQLGFPRVKPISTLRKGGRKKEETKGKVLATTPQVAVMEGKKETWQTTTCPQHANTFHT